MSAWLEKTCRAPSRHSRDARVYGHTTTAMHKLSPPPPGRRPYEPPLLRLMDVRRRYPPPPPLSHLCHQQRPLSPSLPLPFWLGRSRSFTYDVVVVILGVVAIVLCSGGRSLLFAIEAGSDFVTIDSTDSHFCEDCAYQIGISSVSNSSFTISINHEDEGGAFVVLSRLSLLSSGKTVFTGIVLSPPRYVPSFFVAWSVLNSCCSSIFL